MRCPSLWRRPGLTSTVALGARDRQQHVQQHAGQGGEGDGAGGAEDGELLLDGDSHERGHGPAERPEQRDRGGPHPAISRSSG